MKCVKCKKQIMQIMPNGVNVYSALIITVEQINGALRLKFKCNHCSEIQVADLVPDKVVPRASIRGGFNLEKRNNLQSDK